MPATARQYGVNPDDLFDPHVSRHTAGRILTDLMARYRNDEPKVLAGYNAGPGRVDSGRELPHETRSYVSRFLSLMGPSEASAAESSPSAPHRITIDPKDFTPTSKSSAPIRMTIDPKDFTPAEPEFHKPLPGAVQFAEDYILPAVGGAGGAAVGGAIAGPVGAVAGAGAGQVGADYLSAQINQRFFGRHPDLSAANVVSSEWPNAVMGMIGEAIPVGKLLGTPLGIPQIAGGAKEVATQAGESAERFGEQQATTTGEGLTKIGTAQAQTAEALAPKARGEVIQQSLGRTVEQGAQARAGQAELSGGAALPSPETIGRQQQWHDAVFNPIHRAAKVLGAQYDNLFGRVRGVTLKDTAALRYSLDGITQQEKEMLGPTVAPGAGVQKLFKMLKAMVAPSAKSEIDAEFSPEALAALPPDLREYFSAMAGDIKKELAKDTAPEASLKPTVNRLLQARSAATALTRGNISSRDKVMAFHAIEAIDGQLEQSGLVDMDRLGAINSRYGSYKKTFDPMFRRKIATEFEPTDAAGDIFGSPQRLQQIWGGATEEEKSTLKETYADWLLRRGVDPAAKAIETPDQKRVLETMFPNTPLADPKNWIHLDNKLATARNIIDTSPALKQEYDKTMTARIQEIGDEADRSAITWAQREAPKLGPYAEGMLKKVRQAKSPREGAAIIVDFMQRHPEEAPVQALQKGLADSKAGGFVSKAKRGLQWYPEILLATAAMGHPSYYAAASMGTAAVAGVHVGLKAALKGGLKNETTARLFWRAVNNPDAFARTRMLARFASDGVMADAVNQLAGGMGTRLADQDSAAQPNP